MRSGLFMNVVAPVLSGTRERTSMWTGGFTFHRQTCSQSTAYLMHARPIIMLSLQEEHLPSWRWESRKIEVDRFSCRAPDRIVQYSASCSVDHGHEQTFAWHTRSSSIVMSCSINNDQNYMQANCFEAEYASCDISDTSWVSPVPALPKRCCTDQRFGGFDAELLTYAQLRQ